MGLWLVLFLIEHLLVNSQAALLLGENGRGFVHMVNSIHNLPYLPFIECFLLGVPILIHGFWGVRYLFESKSNVWNSKKSSVTLPYYGRNYAFTFQRITSWILMIGIILHVLEFRFLHYPASFQEKDQIFYFVKLNMDKGLYTVAERLGVDLYGPYQIQIQKQESGRRGEESLLEICKTIEKSELYDTQQEMLLTSAQAYQQKLNWIKQLENIEVQPHQVIAVAKDFGTASILVVRDTFKNIFYSILYTVFVLAACFHAFNGLWTFCLTWGVILKASMQKKTLIFVWILIGFVSFLGFSSIWGTYWLNLKT